MELTQRQETFCLNILRGMGQREAYIKAGYSTNMSLSVIDVKASELARNGKVSVRIKELRQIELDATIATVEERKQILTEIARGRVGTLLDDNQRIKQGEPLTDASIQEVDTFDIKIGKGENARLAQITKIKLHNPVPAVDLLNKMERIYDTDGIKIDNRTLNIYVNSDKAKDLTQRLIEGERTDAT